MINPKTATLDEIRAWVAERMAGSQEPVQGYFVHPDDREPHGPGSFIDVHFCEAHAFESVKKRGLDPAQSEPLADAPSEWIWACDTCDVPLRGSLNDEGVDEMLSYFLGEGEDPPSDRMHPDEWRDLSLCLVSPSKEQLLRIRLIIACALIAGSPS